MKKYLTILVVVMFFGILSFPNIASTQVNTNYWKLLSGILQPNLSSWQFEIPQLGGNGTRCVQVNNSGLFSTASAGCGSGSGNSLASSSPWIAGQVTYVVSNSTISSTATTSVTCTGSTTCTSFNVLGSSPITINSVGSTQAVSTSTNETAGQLAYWTSTNATPATLGKIATTTLTGSGVVSISNSPVVIGASGAVATITGGSNGQTLAWSGGVPAWVATSTAGTGLVYTATGAGAGNIALTVPVTVANGGTNSTSYASNVLIYANNAGTSLVATSSDPLWLSSFIATSTSNKSGISTSTPWGIFSINPVAGFGTAPLFAIGSSSGQIFTIANTGATTHITPSPTANALFISTSTAGNPIVGVDTKNSSSAVFSVASSTGQTYFYISNAGYLVTAGTSTPTLTSCGTSPTVVGDALHFTITVGSVSASGCTATFPNAPLPSTPHCNVTNQSMSVVNALTYTESTSAVVISMTGLTGDLVDVNCTLSGQS